MENFIQGNLRILSSFSESSEAFQRGRGRGKYICDVGEGHMQSGTRLVEE